MTDREGGDQAVIPFLAIAVLAVPVSSHDCLVAAHEGIQPTHALEHFVQGRIFLRGEAGQIQAGQAPAPGEHGTHALNLTGVKAAQITAFPQRPFPPGRSPYWKRGWYPAPVSADPFRSGKSPSLGFHPQGGAYTSF